MGRVAGEQAAGLSAVTLELVETLDGTELLDKVTRGWYPAALVDHARAGGVGAPQHPAGQPLNAFMSLPQVCPECRGHEGKK